MNTLTLALVVLRGLARLYANTGYHDRAVSLQNLATLIQVGRASVSEIDFHMQKVAEALESEDPKDWDDLMGRISTASERLG